MSVGPPDLVLPFAVIEREGSPAQEFPFEMTLATVLADVEKRREKAGVLRRREEGLEFASLLYWPIVVTPWKEDRHLVFDGMGVWSYVFSRGLMPDARSFGSEVEAARDHRSLLSLLDAKASHFDKFVDMERVPVVGLFIHEEFMKDVLSHIALGKPKEIRPTAVLAPRLSTGQAEQAVRQMRGLIEAMVQDIDALSSASKALDRALDRARKDFADERDKVGKAYAQKIERIRPDVNAQVARLEREREERWAAMQPRLLDLQAHVHKAEADLAGWDAEARRRDDLDAASRARERRDVARDELLRAREAVQRYRDEMAQTRANFDRQVQTQWDRIRELERERDAEVGALNQREGHLVSLVGRLSLAIAGLSRELAQTIQFIDAQGVQATVQGMTTVRMPIMVASLTSDRGRRMILYPPMVARAGKGVLGSLKATFGGAVLPLEPKTEQFEEIFRDGIEKAFGEDTSLAAYVASLGNSNNLLHLANLRELLTRGLAEMKAQGWIKDKHERELLVNLERHIEAARKTAPPGGP